MIQYMFEAYNMSTFANKRQLISIYWKDKLLSLCRTVIISYKRQPILNDKNKQDGSRPILLHTCTACTFPLAWTLISLDNIVGFILIFQ